MTPRLQIGIAGAGMGGLASAIALHCAGHRVRIFDKFDQPRPVGSGLVVQPVGQRATRHAHWASRSPVSMAAKGGPASKP